MSSSDEGELDHILGGAELDKLETMNLSPQQQDCSQELLGVVPAPTDDAISTVGLAPHEGSTEELRGGGSCQGPSFSFSHTTCSSGDTSVNTPKMSYLKLAAMRIWIHNSPMVSRIQL